MYKRIAGLAIGIAALSLSPHRTTSEWAFAQDSVEADDESRPSLGSAPDLVAAIDDAHLRELLGQVLSANPTLAVESEQVNIAANASTAAGWLPDPKLNTSLFLLPPETRVGAQIASVGLTQQLPPRGVRAAQRRAGEARTEVHAATYGAVALQQVTTTRVAYHELQFVNGQRQIMEEKQAHLAQHEEIARSRYATGFGRGQDVIKLQAEISRVESELLTLAAVEQGLRSRLNGLRDRASTHDLNVTPLQNSPATTRVHAMAVEDLVDMALACRPEMAAARALQTAAQAATALAEAQFQPGWTVGASYTYVDNRDDLAARMMPPDDDGQDIVALHGSVNLPVRRQRLIAEAAAAESHELAAQLEIIAIAASIRTQVEDLAARIPLILAQLEINRDLLTVQAEEALESARSGYVAGTSSALDLLDAEHLLFETRTTTARAVANLKIAMAQLEGAIAAPVAEHDHPEECPS